MKKVESRVERNILCSRVCRPTIGCCRVSEALGEGDVGKAIWFTTFIGEAKECKEDKCADDRRPTGQLQTED